MARDNRDVAIITGDEEPLMVEDDKYSLEPTSNRQDIVDIFILLSQKAHDCLLKDCSENNRYARRLIISNQIGKKSRGPRRRDEYLVKLPLDGCCWNDYSSEEIQLYMLLTIQGKEYEKIEWFNVRVFLDQFICHMTREIFYEECDYVNDGPSQQKLYLVNHKSKLEEDEEISIVCDDNDDDDDLEILYESGIETQK